MNVASFSKVYFLGIGGIGMSALARFFMHRGIQVLGYDRVESELTRSLVEEGASIIYTEDPKHLPTDIDLVIWTPAIPANSVLFQFCKDQKFVLKKRSEVLGMLSRDHYCLAVAGTHGKTTVTTMLTHILSSAGKAPTAFLGGISVNFNGNFIVGDGGMVILEADEYDRSFLQLFPNRLIVTSMDPDHLDIYGTHEEMLGSYLQFCRQVNKRGSIHIHHSLLHYFEGWQGCDIKTYGLNTGDFYAKNIGPSQGYMNFDWVFPGGEWSGIQLPFPGYHNVENATAAISIAYMEGVTEDQCRKALLSFKGIKRRFEQIAVRDGRVFIDDYAHHPAEITAAVKAARNFYPSQKILGIFQPHLFSRTSDFYMEFAAALDLLDECILLDIYPARELPIPGVTSRMIADQMKLKDTMVTSKDQVIEILKEKQFDILLTLGAGDIDRIIENIKANLFGG